MRARPQPSRLAALALGCALASPACGARTGLRVPPLDASRPDVAPDVARDAPPDVTPDVALDAPPDIAPDVPVDIPVDVPADAPQRPVDNVGTEFFAVATANSQLRPEFSFAVVLANPQSDRARVTISGGALPAPVEREVAPGGVETVALPNVPALLQNGRDRPPCGDARCPATSVLARGGAYRIVSSVPIAAYQFNPLRFREGATPQFSFTNDASTLLPVATLGTEYLALTWPNWRFLLPGLDTVLGGFVAITATGPGLTRVTVRTAAGTAGGDGVARAPAGATQSFTLARGDVLQLVGDGDFEDLSGTSVVSDNPVAVFAGHDCTQVPNGTPACDHLEEQLVPERASGRGAVLTQFRDRGDAVPYFVRVMSLRDGNRLTFDGVRPPCPPTLDRGRVCQFEALAAGFVVTGTQPLTAMTFMRGQGVGGAPCDDPPRPDCMGDPAMASAPPVEQFRRRFDFLVPDTYVRNLVNVVAPRGASVLLDGAPLAGSRADFGAGYTVWFAEVGAGRHQIVGATPETRVGIMVYGVAPYTSYAYPGGLGLEVLRP